MFVRVSELLETDFAPPVRFFYTLRGLNKRAVLQDQATYANSIQTICTSQFIGKYSTEISNPSLKLQLFEVSSLVESVPSILGQRQVNCNVLHRCRLHGIGDKLAIRDKTRVNVLREGVKNTLK